MVIGFSGLDGCGKSTIIKALTEFLDANESSRKKVRVVWTRVGYTPGINFLKNVARKLLPNKLPAPGRSTARTKGLKKPFVQRLWITISLLELIWIFVVKLRFLSFGKVLLLDRQIDDSLIDLKILFGENIFNDKLYSFLVYLLKTLSVKIEKIAIDIDLETSDYRCSIKFEPFPDLPEEKSRRIKLYDEIIESEEFSLVLDGTDEIKDNLKVIKNAYFNI